ncbi:inositol monophosphatase/fructose-1,6-bisphosphatase family protein [Halovivax ruber XH-70]|uniref:fructose-bisphosphatase n=1 Tax=Halovivax ruber (strain DSM 18193 / JCM 13892 / XH-70) TaxID=797302 RepID=L0ICT6_HALRX|nr:inositol monophosphatase [Halovivax ruber]AGB16041.1 inositol monophosphatase/fructose-1,6-bisphosphatase family protein [Halovivax ruber XH-70]
MNASGNPDARVDVAVDAASAGAAVAQNAFRSDLAVETKSSKTDVVTQADRDAQRAVIERIETAYPNERIVGEEDEQSGAIPDDGRAWIVDPIDGTANFVAGIPTFCTAVAAVDDGEAIAAALDFPVTGDQYVFDGTDAWLNDDELAVSDRADPHVCTVSPTLWWGRDRRDEYASACSEIVHRFADLRRVRCAQAELAMVASGAQDGTFANVSAHPWDTVAGVSLVRAAGGTVTDLDGNQWRHDSDGLVASNGEIHSELLEAANAVDDVAEPA